MTPEYMSQYTYIVTDNCNFQANWIMNIRGTGDVTFTGAFMAVPDGAVIINVIGQRNVYVTGIRLNAHLLAVDATLNQTGGVIVGKVVAGNVAFALQVNHQNTCPHITTINIPVVPQPPNVPDSPPIDVTTGDQSGSSSSSGSASSTSSGSDSSSSSSGTNTPVTTGEPTPVTPSSGCLTVYAASSLENGDSITFLNSDGSSASAATINYVSGSTVCATPSTNVPKVVYAQVAGYVSVSSNDGRRYVANTPDTDSSSATSMGVAAILLAIVAMFI